MVSRSGRFPQTYENVPTRDALRGLAENPTRDGFTALLSAVQQGGLVVDVTGSDPEEVRLRTMRSTTGELVLPLFTSIAALRSAVAATSEKQGTRVHAVIVPAREAIGYLRSADFVAVQFDPGAEHTLIVARSHLEELLDQTE